MSYSPKQTIEEGYNKFVVKNKEGCWGWTGCAPKNPGYGQFRSNTKLYRAHIASWLIHNGPIPKGLCVCHKCDNSICSNPDHLFLGTQKDNLQDMFLKGRNRGYAKRGSSNRANKYSVDLVRRVKKLIKERVPGADIARIFNVRPAWVSDIKTGKLWNYDLEGLS